jgi:uncharacterized protein (DUF2336 family)
VEPMGLTAQDMSDMTQLANLVSNPRDATREEIYLAVSSLYRVQDIHMNARERALANDILRRLTKDVEMSIRIALAERLADDAVAPHDLILLLADDRIEVARPVLLRSPILTESDILRLIVENGPAHQEAIASRPDIGEKISDTLASTETPSVLTALVRNATARISPDTFAKLAETSRRIEALQKPLAERRDMPQDVAAKMCTFVSDTLKTFIIHNFTIDQDKLNAALSGAQTAVRAAPQPPAPDAPVTGIGKLIEKLFLAGQLKASFLIRVLQQGNIDLFELGLARLLGLSTRETRQILYERGHTSVALACRAIGIDRSVFATVYNLSHKARALRPMLSDADMTEVDTVFEKTTKTSALRQLQDGSRG